MPIFNINTNGVDGTDGTDGTGGTDGSGEPIVRMLITNTTTNTQGRIPYSTISETSSLFEDLYGETSTTTDTIDNSIEVPALTINIPRAGRYRFIYTIDDAPYIGQSQNINIDGVITTGFFKINGNPRNFGGNSLNAHRPVNYNDGTHQLSPFIYNGVINFLQEDNIFIPYYVQNFFNELTLSPQFVSLKIINLRYF